jgi:hypothetical protein
MSNAPQDSQIVHPVALRMSPDGQITAVDGKVHSGKYSLQLAASEFFGDGLRFITMWVADLFAEDSCVALAIAESLINQGYVSACF